MQNNIIRVFFIFCWVFTFQIRNLLGQNSLTNGLILCYPFNKSYNDAAGNGFHAGKNSTELVADRFNREESACFFNGINSFIEINPTPFKIDYFSISLWIRLDTPPEVNKPQYLWSAGSNNGEQSIILERIGSQIVLKAGGAVSETENIYCEFSGIGTSRWYHLVFLREPNNIYLFVNGKQVSSQPNIGKGAFYGTDFPRVYLGTSKRIDGFIPNFNGIIDDVHIYGRVITSFEINKLFEGEKQPEIELIIDNLSLCGGETVYFLIKGAAETANYLWKIGDFKKEVYVNKFEFETIKKPDDYDLDISVEIIDDFSCFPQKPIKATNKIKVKVCSELINLNIPDIFTPNGDGVNDKWIIPNLARIPEANLYIYNRNGILVFQSKGYTKPWDGTINGASIVPDNYNYIIQTNIKGEKTIKGSVAVVW